MGYEAKANEELKNKIMNEIGRMAVALNGLMVPGSTISVSIEPGKILIPGQPPMKPALIIISKPAIIQQIGIQINNQPAQPVEAPAEDKEQAAPESVTPVTPIEVK